MNYCQLVPNFTQFLNSSFIDSARSFLKKHQLGQYNEEEVAKKKAEQAALEEEQKAAAEAITVGSRCKVEVANQPTKLGTVMFVGKLLFLFFLFLDASEFK